MYPSDMPHQLEVNIMDKQQRTKIQEFNDVVHDMIDSQGLLGIGSVRFDRGGSTIDVLKSAQFGYAVSKDFNVLLSKRKKRYISIAQIANRYIFIFTAINHEECKPYSEPY